MNLRTWTLSEAHRETGIPVRALRKMIDAGTLKGNRTGKWYRVSVASLEAWVTSTPEPLAPMRAFPDVEDRFA